MARQSTINSLSEELDCDSRSVKKWLERENIAPSNYEAAKECVARHKKDYQQQQTDSPQRRKLEEEVKKLARLNRIADRLEAKEYIKVSTVEKMLLMGLQRLELIPLKLQSEFNLPEPIVKRTQQLYDEARESWAARLTELDASDSATVL